MCSSRKGLLYDNADFEASELFHGQPVIRNKNQKVCGSNVTHRNLVQGTNNNGLRKRHIRQRKISQVESDAQGTDSEEDPTFHPGNGLDWFDESQRSRKPKLKRFEYKDGNSINNVIFTSYNSNYIFEGCLYSLLKGQPVVSNMLNSCPNLMQKNQIEDIPDLEFDLSLDDILTLSDSLNSTCEFTMHDAPAICRGQPLTKSFPKIISQLKMQLHLQQGADDESGEQEFLIATQDLEKLSSQQFCCNLYLYKKMQIQRLQQNIVQLYRQVGPTKIFEETNQFKVCVNKNEYIPIVVQPHANSEKRRVEVIYTDSCQLPYTRRMLGISSEKELELNRRKPGKGTSFKSELLITDTDLTLESIHKRCRSRKASLQALYDEHVTLGTFLQHSTCADFKLLIKTLLIAITDPKHLLQFSQDFPSEVNIILTKLKKQLINGVLMSKEFLEELESRPNMQQRAGAGGNICEALQENCGIRADRVVTLYGSPYHPNTFAPLHSNQVKRFFVSSQLGNKCKAYHSLHHYKYYLFEKCKEKYNKVKRPRFSNPLKFDAKSHCYPSNSDGGNFKDVEPSADPKKHVWTSSNEKVQQIKSKTEIESVLGSSVLECLDDAEWINKLYNHWIGIYTWVSQLLQEEK